MALRDELRVMTKVARLYYEQDMLQAEIAAQISRSSSNVSHLLQRAKKEDIVDITINVPDGIYPELEESLLRMYKLKDVIVVDSAEDHQEIFLNLGSAAAYYLETTLHPNDVLGFSPWSSTQLEMVATMQPLKRATRIKVLQLLSVMSGPSAEIEDNRFIGRLANLVRGEAILLPVPDIAVSMEAVPILWVHRYFQKATELFDQVTIALVDIENIESSGMLANGGNIFSTEELNLVGQTKAVGNICLRFFDAAGTPVATPFNDKIIAISLEQLRRVNRSVGIAGGKQNVKAIQATLRSGLINVLITDRFAAQQLFESRNENETG